VECILTETGGFGNRKRDKKEKNYDYRKKTFDYLKKL
jgi:hypothetical protein